MKDNNSANEDSREGNGKQHFISGAIDLLAGSAGGAANVFVGQPLDTVKVKVQTFPQLYKNSLYCFTETLKKDGIRRGLYAGTVPALAANIAENSVLFCAYGFCQNLVKSLRKTTDKSLTPLDNAFAGFFAAFFSSFTLCPTELIKCKLQALRETSAVGQRFEITPYSLTKKILTNEGISGLFRGLTSTMAREMPGYFFFFGSYELSKQLIRPKHWDKDRDLGLWRTIICGGIGGIGLWTSIFPFDVIKSRIQVQSSRDPMHKVLREILAKEGVRSLYRGLGPTLLRTFPSTGALFVAYEESKRMMTSFAFN